jgi:hypothetical protein
MRRSIILACLCVLLTIARSEVPTRDVSAIVLSLKDEKAECRLLMQLCADYDEANKAWMSATFHNPGGGKEEEAAMDRAHADLTHVVETLLVKHEKLPRCVNDCLREHPMARSCMVKWHPEPKEPGSKDWVMPKSLVK